MGCISCRRWLHQLGQQEHVAANTGLGSSYQRLLSMVLGCIPAPPFHGTWVLNWLSKTPQPSYNPYTKPIARHSWPTYQVPRASKYVGPLSSQVTLDPKSPGSWVKEAPRLLLQPVCTIDLDTRTADQDVYRHTYRGIILIKINICIY